MRNEDVSKEEGEIDDEEETGNSLHAQSTTVNVHQPANWCVFFAKIYEPYSGYIFNQFFLIHLTNKSINLMWKGDLLLCLYAWSYILGLDIKVLVLKQDLLARANFVMDNSLSIMLYIAHLILAHVS